jgi:hypothetical protein
VWMKRTTQSSPLGLLDTVDSFGLSGRGRAFNDWPVA